MLSNCVAERWYLFFVGSATRPKGGRNPTPSFFIHCLPRGSLVSQGGGVQIYTLATPSPAYLFKHVKHGTQNIRNYCHQWLSGSFRVHNSFSAQQSGIQRSCTTFQWRYWSPNTSASIKASCLEGKYQQQTQLQLEWLHAMAACKTLECESNVGMSRDTTCEPSPV